MVKSKDESHFVLVHGSGHGAWCWYKLASLLKSAGHTVTAMDLTASGINLKTRKDIKTISDYIEPLIELLAGLPTDDKVVIVGHSMGGIPISIAMERFPHKIKVGVFLTAVMPGPNLTVSQIEEFNSSILGPDDRKDLQFIHDNGANSPPTSLFFGPNYLAHKLYQNSPPEDLELANKLVRPYPTFYDEKSKEEELVTEENYGSVRRVFIISGQDMGLVVPLQKFMIENNAPDEVMEIHDSDHMVMVSRPKQLCSCLLDIASKY